MISERKPGLRPCLLRWTLYWTTYMHGVVASGDDISDIS